MELAFDVQKMPLFMLMIMVSHLPGVSGLIIYNTTATACDGSRANITFDFDLQNGTIPSGSEAWYYEETVIATNTGGMFSTEQNYTGRLHTYSTYGIALDSVTAADAGRYLFFFSYRSPTPQGFKTATSTLTVKVAPRESCTLSYRQSGDLAICELDQAANCGTPRLEPKWSHTSGNSFTVGKPDKYICCASGSILTDCYRGNNSFCKTFYLPGDKSLEIGVGVGVGVGVPVVATIIVLVICIKKGKIRICKPKEPADKKSEVPLESTDTNGKTNNSGPPAVHIGTQNKVDPNSSSKQTNVRQQPVPPANTGFEDTPTIRPQPPPPQNGYVRGISATIDDTQDLASDNPNLRPSRLSPISPKQATVQKENASKEPKKKRKKKKKDQINEETPEEENGKSNLRVN